MAKEREALQIELELHRILRDRAPNLPNMIQLSRVIAEYTHTLNQQIERKNRPRGGFLSVDELADLHRKRQAAVAVFDSLPPVLQRFVAESFRDEDRFYELQAQKAELAGLSDPTNATAAAAAHALAEARPATREALDGQAVRDSLANEDFELAALGLRHGSERRKHLVSLASDLADRLFQFMAQSATLGHIPSPRLQQAIEHQMAVIAQQAQLFPANSDERGALDAAQQRLQAALDALMGIEFGEAPAPRSHRGQANVNVRWSAMPTPLPVPELLSAGTAFPGTWPEHELTPQPPPSVTSMHAAALTPPASGGAASPPPAPALDISLTAPTPPPPHDISLTGPTVHGYNFRRSEAKGEQLWSSERQAGNSIGPITITPDSSNPAHYRVKYDCGAGIHPQLLGDLRKFTPERLAQMAVIPGNAPRYPIRHETIEIYQGAQSLTCKLEALPGPSGNAMQSISSSRMQVSFEMLADDGRRLSEAHALGAMPYNAAVLTVSDATAQEAVAIKASALKQALLRGVLPILPPRELTQVCQWLYQHDRVNYEPLMQALNVLASQSLNLPETSSVKVFIKEEYQNVVLAEQRVASNGSLLAPLSATRGRFAEGEDPLPRLIADYQEIAASVPGLAPVAPTSGSTPPIPSTPIPTR